MIYRSRTNEDGGWSIEYCHCNGGQRTYIQEVGLPVCDDFGRIIKTLGTTQNITQRKRAEEDLRQSHALFQQAETISNMGHFCWDLVKDRLISCSDQYARIFDMTVQEALDCFTTTDAIINFIVPKDKETFKKSIDLYSKLTKAYDVEFQITTRLGNKQNLFSRRQYSYDNDGLPLLTFGTLHDNTTEKVKELALKAATEAALQANKALVFQKHALDQHAIVSITDTADNFIYVNNKFCEISGYDREELLQLNQKKLRSDEHSEEFFADRWKTISSGQTWHGEVKSTSKTGINFWAKATIVPTLDDQGKPFQYVAIRTEITERKQAEEKLENIAHYDLLTNLPNRVLLADRLSQSMAQCKRRNQSLAVVFLDLDGFKAVNDTHGHSIGDKLLVALSKHMKEALREGDTLARIGGDEFIALIVDLDNIDDIKPVLARLLKAASNPAILDDVLVDVSTSIGVTLYPKDGVEADQLMRHADQAMYIAKQEGKNRYHLFDTDNNNAIEIQQKERNNIRLALSNSEFVLHYQPKVNMLTGEVIGVEALIRWQHPNRGLVLPLEFLPAIEGHAIGPEVGEWVIGTALNQISQWQSIGLNLAVSVNISAYQLQQDNFTAHLATLLAAYPEVKSNQLELEILETSELSDIGRLSATIEACHELGVRFALDDFGTGYSSLNHLRRLPAYMIKIDQSFVRDMLEDTDDLAIVEGVIGLAKTFQREVIAEGVETIAHGEALLKLGCQLAQGYAIARPMPEIDIPEWVSSWKVNDTWKTF